jgi:carbamoyl-phosphate synthase large subunit
MPRRDDLQTILLIGSGPIVIGQACEFDYSGTQACKALREDGYRVVLVNSNPATIMTDPGTADRTYIEPLTCEMLEKVIEAEKPDAVLPTLGGQTALNLAMELDRRGILAKHGVEMIGAKAEAIKRGEDREIFKALMDTIGLESCRSRIVKSLAEAREAAAEIGLPAVIRPSFTLGGSGSGIVFNREEFDAKVQRGLDLSPVGEVLIEESILGWKEFEMEVMRDADDNAVVICSIENFDPCGVHTGDSITVAPALTLTDRQYQRMRDASFAVIRAVGVETGGSNIQFAVDPKTGRMVVIEMNPRVSRSSALASKATGFPIAKIAAKLAVGWRLHELPNDITRMTKACFEPSIDYVVVKVPRFAFEKFPEADPRLTTQMKSVGETMAIGRTFKEAFQKALRGLEVGAFGLGCDGKDLWGTPAEPGLDDIRARIATPDPDRVWYLRYALLAGLSVDEIHEITAIDRWFLDQLAQLVELESLLRTVGSLAAIDDGLLRAAKQAGYSDRQLATLLGSAEMEVRAERKRRGIVATYKAVDTCAAEFEAQTPYYYSTWEEEDETRPKEPGRTRVMILGGGPNRIGQGIEFDYCCCHASFALRELGIESVMVNSNPETVSTDYDTSDMLFFEPLTCEDVLNIADRIDPDGVIVQLGGQTPLNLARALQTAGLRVIGTTVDTIEMAEDREQFRDLLDRLGLKQPASGIARTLEQARREVARIGFPALVRPSFVLGGRAMEICYDHPQFERYVAEAFAVAQGQPVLIDRFLEDAIEVDVDCIADGTDVIVAGVMEHIEEAGVHSGDSACCIPPHGLSAGMIAEIKSAAAGLARSLGVVGLMNVQFAVKKETNAAGSDGQSLYVIEVNPRASRTVPFVAKATGVPVAKVAVKVMAGELVGGTSLAAQGLVADPVPAHVSVKESVFPFVKFAGVDIVLGPEMRSTGEVMGVSDTFAIAFAKSQLAAGIVLPQHGRIFLSVASSQAKAQIVGLARRLVELGFDLMATSGTARALADAGIAVEEVKKLQEGHPNLIDHLIDGRVQLIFNTPRGKGARTDEGRIRAASVLYGVPCITTMPAAEACVRAMEGMQKEPLAVQPIQDRFPEAVSTRG